MFPDQQAEIFYSPSADDAQAYAQDFLTIFKAVGWTVSEAEPAEIATAQSADLALLVSLESNPPPGAEALRDTLRIYGIDIAVCRDSARYIAPDSFVLVIGSPI